MNILLAIIGIPLFMITGAVLFITGIAVLDAINTACHGNHIAKVLERMGDNRGNV